MRNIKRISQSTTADGKMLYLADGTIQSCNTNACKILGCGLEQLVGQLIWSLSWQINYNNSTFFLDPTQFANGMSLGFCKFNGDSIQLLVNAVGLCKADDDELYGVELSFVDVTSANIKSIANKVMPDSEEEQEDNCHETVAHDREQISIAESEQRLKLATDASGIGMWFWDIIKDEIEWTELGKAIFGLPAEEKLSFQKCFDMIHVEDRHLVRAKIDEALANKTQYRIEYRIVWSDNSVHWIVAKGKGVYRIDGEPVSMMGTVQDISDRHETEQKLKNNEQLLKLALKNAKAGLWDWDLVSQEIAWSQENYELYGIDPNIKPLRFQDWEHTLHPDDIAASNAEIEKILSGESQEFATEFRIFHPQKGIRWVLGVGDVIYNLEGKPIRLSGLNLDITRLKETEAAFQRSKQDLKQRERELQLITEVIPQQIWTAGMDGHMDYINHRWQNYTGLDLAQMQAKGWASIVHPEDLEDFKANWIKSIHIGENFNAEARLRNANGTYRWFLSKARPLYNEKREIVKWYGTNTDINRSKELEEKLRQQAKDLIEANRLKDDFLAIVSHELRTPLNPILGWSQMLAGDKLDRDFIIRGLSIIERNAKLQSQIIDDLLDVSSILRGKLKLNKTPQNLEMVIRAALTTVELSAADKSIAIETEFESIDGRVLGDTGRLQQIVWNLVVNAVKFTPTDGRVFVKLNQIGNKAVIKIEDTGRGIEPNFIPYVFDRFRQENSASTREFGGLGLGLAIVKHLTELHNGRVTVASAGLGKGATFTVELPLMDLPNSKSTDTSLQKQSIQPNRFDNLTILVVDDEVDSLEMLTLVLQCEGAEVISFTSPKAALEILNQTTPELIISDIGMPEIDGYTLIEEIRQRNQAQNIPAIALSAHAKDTDIQQSFAAGFQKHMTKPIDIPLLLTTITELLPSKSQ